MYAIVEVGGKQYKVEPGKYFFTEKVSANVKISSKAIFFILFQPQY